MHYDLIIIGGGLVGAGLAHALRDTSLRIALIDARLPTNDDPRLFALNYGSCQFLSHLGIWPALAEKAAPIHQVHVSRQGHLGAVRLHHQDVNLPHLGHVIPAYSIEIALNNALTSQSNLTLYRPAKLTQLKQHADTATLTIETQQGDMTLQSNMVIGADGTQSTVRNQIKMNAQKHDYGQSAIVTRIALKRSHQHIAYERFTANGAVALLPLIGNDCAMIWTSESACIANYMSLSDDDFLAEIQKIIGYRLGRLENIKERHVFPLQQLQAEKALDGCVLLLGNALHTLHPIAAQGFNLALYEVALLVETLSTKLAKNEPISAALLQEVVAQITPQQAISIKMSHRLAQLFSHDSAFMSMLLQLGMLSLDKLTPIKKHFMTRIMGRAGRVPRLLLGARE